MDWIISNIANIIIVLAIGTVVVTIVCKGIRNLIYPEKSGASCGCSGSCTSCGMDCSTYNKKH